MELIITVAIVPLIVGALGVGLLTVFKFQSSVSSRLGDSSDAQIFESTFANDVQGASVVSTQSSSSPQCGSGTQLVGLESDLNAATGNYDTIISYATAKVGSGSSATYEVVRNICQSNGETDFTGVVTPTGTTIAVYDDSSSQSAAQFTCASAYPTCSPSSGWTAAVAVQLVTIPVTEAQSGYSYSLSGAPVSQSTSAASLGSPGASTTNAGCNFAAPGSGTLASTLCFVDFSSMTGAALAQAQSGSCLEMSASLQGGFTLYFCLAISGTGAVQPSSLPTYPQAFLGNQIGSVPFYNDVNGAPALYQNQEGGNSVINFTGIQVLNAAGQAATGWEVASADAESTDNDESITWTSNTNLYWVPNGLAADTSTAPFGNACEAGSGLTPAATAAATTTATCAGLSGTTSNTKTGTAMVRAVSPTTLTATLVGGGLEGITFGLLVS